MRLEDALFNWLQIKIVAEARQDDHAAEETRLFFEEIIRDDHAVTSFETTEDETMVHIHYEVEGKRKRLMFDKESVEQLLHDINSNPKYNNQ
ncbi:hypothetical protein [Paenibacillus radicis (ex Xue et al. 2023)]|uniref:Uncharacterized protein n=1 Tax=Paenibacillus radicis (ex Xue et al. 2023) TaxID=2972489 RepID=A0ABT1YRI8_9BACL|nr:hypothetical protein [Paenibacillus radicis (ex Xue et al. 2023)]MCR8634994.1 hypothetical protein [Paenibacillus radicis (ex Xue et al. 2023)]